MTKADYEELVTKLKLRLFQIEGERSELEVRRAELDNEAANVKAAITKLLPLCGETANPEDLSGLGFTDAVLQVIELARPERLTAQQIKERLAEKGFELSGYTNPMASIYKILSRLDEAKKIETVREGFNSYYKATRKHVYVPRRRRVPLTPAPAPAVGPPGYAPVPAGYTPVVPPGQKTLLQRIKEVEAEKEKK